MSSLAAAPGLLGLLEQAKGEVYVDQYGDLLQGATSPTVHITPETYFAFIEVAKSAERLRKGLSPIDSYPEKDLSAALDYLHQVLPRPPNQLLGRTL